MKKYSILVGFLLFMLGGYLSYLSLSFANEASITLIKEVSGSKLAAITNIHDKVMMINAAADQEILQGPIFLVALGLILILFAGMGDLFSKMLTSRRVVLNIPEQSQTPHS